MAPSRNVEDLTRPISVAAGLPLSLGLALFSACVSFATDPMSNLWLLARVPGSGSSSTLDRLQCGHAHSLDLYSTSLKSRRGRYQTTHSRASRFLSAAGYSIEPTPIAA